MFRNINELTGYKIAAIDGEIGKVDDFYFDDQNWFIRYLIADTGNWLESKLVLLSPTSLKQPDWTKKVFPVKLRKDQISRSPDVSKDKPVSRQNEVDLAGYYEWPMYWDAGMSTVPMTNYILTKPELEQGFQNNSQEDKPKGDPHLRSCKEVTGYNIQTKDKEIGHIDDFLLEDETWRIRYLVLNTRNWLPGGKKVLLSPLWIDKIEWSESKIYVDLPHQLIKEAPEYDPSMPVSREYEENLFSYFTKEKYWK